MVNPHVFTAKLAKMLKQKALFQLLYRSLKKIPYIYLIKRIFFRNRLLVINYHSVSDHVIRGNKYLGSIKVDLIIDHLIRLKNMFNIVNYPKLLSETFNKKNHSILITFDDGYRDNYTKLYPILKELNIPAIFFLVSNFIDNNELSEANCISYAIEESGFAFVRDFLYKRGLNFPDKVTEYSLIWYLLSINDTNIVSKVIDDLLDTYNLGRKKLANILDLYINSDDLKKIDQDLITLGSHTFSHKNLRFMNYEDQKAEIEKGHSSISNFSILDFTDIPFAFPFGTYNLHFNDVSLQICNNLNFKKVFSCEGKYKMKRNSFIIDRTPISSEIRVNQLESNIY